MQYSFPHENPDPHPALIWLRELIEHEKLYFSLDALLMYAMTLIIETPVIMIRIVLVAIAWNIVTLIEDHTLTGSSNAWICLALIPTFWSALALITPLGSAWWWRTRAGGRDPSSREQLAYQDATELLQANSETPLPRPAHWFVIDTPQPDAAVVGNALMLSRGLLETEHLPAVLAHELGHLATPDGRVTAALNRTVIFSNPFGHGTDEANRGNGNDDDRSPQERGRGRGHWITRMQEAHKQLTGPSELDPMIDLAYGLLKIVFYLSLLAKGGLGLWITKPAWGQYWRAREYKADQYAAQLGQAEELADFLEIHALIHDHPVPYLWLTEHTHPPTELRIDKLRNPNNEGDEPASDDDDNGGDDDDGGEPSLGTPGAGPLIA